MAVQPQLIEQAAAGNAVAAADVSARVDADPLALRTVSSIRWRELG